MHLLFICLQHVLYGIHINVHIEYKVHVVVIELWGPYGHIRDTGL